MTDSELEANYRWIDRICFNIQLLQKTIDDPSISVEDESKLSFLMEALYIRLINRQRVLEIHLSEIDIAEVINSIHPLIHTQP